MAELGIPDETGLNAVPRRTNSRSYDVSGGITQPDPKSIAGACGLHRHPADILGTYPGITCSKEMVMSQSTRQMFLFFHHTLYALLAALILGVPCTQATAAEETWTPLFNGKDLDGFAFHLGNDRG